MAKFGKNFTYNGKSTEDFHLIICGLEEERDAPLGLEREIDKGDTNSYRTRPNHFGARYSDTLSFGIHLIKDPCIYTNQKTQIFTRSELRAVTSWLTGPRYPVLLHMYDYGEAQEDAPDFFGLFTNVEAFIRGGLYGIKLTIVCDSPYGYSQEKFRAAVCADTMIYTIEVESDELEDYIYPIIEVTSRSGDPVTLTNRSDGGRSITMSLKKDLPVTLDCQKLTVRDSLGLVDFSDLGWGDEDIIYWPRLISGVNEFEITGDCQVAFRYREPQKAGAY